MALNWRGDELSRVFSTELNNIANMNRIGVLNGCKVIPDSPESMDIIIEPGDAFFHDQEVSITGGTVSIDLNASEYDRVDIIVLDKNDNISVIKGTPRELLIPSEYDAEVYLPIALVFVTNVTTQIKEQNIRDIRAINTLHSGGGGEANTASNVGTGDGKLFKEKSLYDLRFKSIKKGTGITVTNNSDDVTIATTAEANTASNVGTGEGKVYKAKSGVDLQLKSIKAGSNISISNNTDDITISGPAGGEANTASNVGTGTGEVYKTKDGVDLKFKTIKAGTAVTITNNTDDVTIATTAEANTASNVGTGTGKVYKAKSGVDLQLKTLKEGTAISISDDTDEITINSSGEANTASNVGTGIGKVYKTKSGSDLHFKSFIAGGGISITNGTNDLTITDISAKNSTTINSFNLDVTTTTDTVDITTNGMHKLTVKNVGEEACYISFTNTATTNDLYLDSESEIIITDCKFTNVSGITATGTTKLSIMVDALTSGDGTKTTSEILKLEVTDSSDSTAFSDSNLRDILIINEGGNACYIAFAATATTSNFVLNSGDVYSTSSNLKTISAIADNGLTTTLKFLGVY